MLIFDACELQIRTNKATRFVLTKKKVNFANKNHLNMTKIKSLSLFYDLKQHLIILADENK